MDLAHILLLMLEVLVFMNFYIKKILKVKMK